MSASDHSEDPTPLEPGVLGPVGQEVRYLMQQKNKASNGAVASFDNACSLYVQLLKDTKPDTASSFAGMAFVKLLTRMEPDNKDPKETAKTVMEEISSGMETPWVLIEATDIEQSLKNRQNNK